jgi:hypothetical protein
MFAVGWLLNYSWKALRIWREDNQTEVGHLRTLWWLCWGLQVCYWRQEDWAFLCGPCLGSLTLVSFFNPARPNRVTPGQALYLFSAFLFIIQQNFTWWLEKDWSGWGWLGVGGVGLDVLTREGEGEGRMLFLGVQENPSSKWDTGASQPTNGSGVAIWILLPHHLCLPHPATGSLEDKGQGKIVQCSRASWRRPPVWTDAIYFCHVQLC